MWTNRFQGQQCKAGGRVPLPEDVMKELSNGVRCAETQVKQSVPDCLVLRKVRNERRRNGNHKALERGCGGLARKPSGWEWVREVRFGLLGHKKQSS